ncbi:MAG: hypothetical protein ACD_74C00080G0004 [uncultured bacterium]|nr:MAG: hypothetical protein ACD_74C00080G0004 [uncultured bacterium]
MSRAESLRQQAKELMEKAKKVEQEERNHRIQQSGQWLEKNYAKIKDLLPEDLRKSLEKIFVKAGPPSALPKKKKV